MVKKSDQNGIPGKGEIILYRSPDGKLELHVRLEGETLWLNLMEIAGLFERDKSVISRHLRNIFRSGELDREATVAFFATVSRKRTSIRFILWYKIRFRTGGICFFLPFAMVSLYNHENEVFMGKFEEFTRFRQEMNRKILDECPLEIKRFFALDERTYQAGALDAKTKELLGLSASLVLRCDDCISYHIIQAMAAGASRQEIYETFSIGLIVGGSIVIPHLRRAVDFMNEMSPSDREG